MQSVVQSAKTRLVDENETGNDVYFGLLDWTDAVGWSCVINVAVGITNSFLDISMLSS